MPIREAILSASSWSRASSSWVEMSAVSCDMGLDSVSEESEEFEGVNRS